MLEYVSADQAGHLSTGNRTGDDSQILESLELTPGKINRCKVFLIPCTVASGMNKGLA